MKIIPKNGFDQLLFGMKQADVIAIYGKPSKQFSDEESNIIFTYNDKKLRLTFYEDEDFRLGYIITSNPEATLFDNKLIGRNFGEIQKELLSNGFKSWEQEDFDLAENQFNEDHWIILQSEFGEIVKIEIGAIINDKDEFDWKFKSK